jgi:FkbM family methyltransferase
MRSGRGLSMHATPPLPAGLNLFGAGRFARDVAQALREQGTEVHALLTSAEPTEALVDGIPCRRLEPTDLVALPLWIAVFNHQRASDYGRLAEWLGGLGPTAQVVWPQAWYGTMAARLGWRFWLHAPEAYTAVQGELACVRERLEDEPSRNTFDQIVAFRSQPRRFAAPPQPLVDTQYLPPWLREHLIAQGVSALRIVDGGAYQGETLRELDDLVPVERAWAFEPDAANAAALRQQMAHWGARHSAFDAGLSDRAGELAFAAGGGGASRVSDAGASRVAVLALDDALRGEPVNFIKLDVEGHELPALAGARATIRRCRPVLAISAYHRWDDLWRLPAFIGELGLDYRLRLAVHQHNSFDTVLYAY